MNQEKKNALETAALKAVGAHPAKLSVTTLALLLKGQRAQLGLSDSPHLGTLEAEDLVDIEAIILQAMASGLLVTASDHFVGLKLTKAGEDVVNRSVLMAFNVCPDAAYQAYYQWRRDVARQRKTPPYRIFPNAILISLANTCPSTLEELLLMGGLGARRINRYQDELLAIGRRLRNQETEVTA